MLFYFPHTTSVLKTLADGALIVLHQKPRFGGVHIRPLDSSDTIETRETHPSSVKKGVWVDVDSELTRRTLPAVYQSTKTNSDHHFQLIYQKGT